MRSAWRRGRQQHAFSTCRVHALRHKSSKHSCLFAASTFPACFTLYGIQCLSCVGDFRYRPPRKLTDHKQPNFCRGVVSRGSLFARFVLAAALVARSERTPLNPIRSRFRPSDVCDLHHCQWQSEVRVGKAESHIVVIVLTSISYSRTEIGIRRTLSAMPSTSASVTVLGISCDLGASECWLLHIPRLHSLNTAPRQKGMNGFVTVPPQASTSVKCPRDFHWNNRCVVRPKFARHVRRLRNPCMVNTVRGHLSCLSHGPIEL